MWDTIRMAILVVVVLAPMWIFANELDGDEFTKSVAGVAAGAAIMTALRLLEKHRNSKNSR